MIFHSTWRRREFIRFDKCFGGDHVFGWHTAAQRMDILVPPLTQSLLSDPLLRFSLYETNYTRSDFSYRTVLYVQFTRIGSPLINFWIISFFPIPYTRDVASHHICECMRKDELFSDITPQHTLHMIQCCLLICQPDVEPILYTFWVEKEKHQKICIVSIRVVDSVKDDETAASTISISAYPLACTTLHPF